MKKLRYLYLNNNSTVGEIPLTLGHLTNLETLKLNWNQISGYIPKEITHCPLLFLHLRHNYFSRSVPSWIGNHFLVEMDFSYNNLTSNVPFSIKNILHFNLSYNSLEGQIPCIFYVESFERFIGNKDLNFDNKDLVKDLIPCPLTSQTMHRVKTSVPLIVFLFLSPWYIFHFRHQVGKIQSKSRGQKWGYVLNMELWWKNCTWRHH